MQYVTTGVNIWVMTVLWHWVSSKSVTNNDFGWYGRACEPEPGCPDDHRTVLFFLETEPAVFKRTYFWNVLENEDGFFCLVGGVSYPTAVLSCPRIMPLCPLWWLKQSQTHGRTLTARHNSEDSSWTTVPDSPMVLGASENGTLFPS